MIKAGNKKGIALMIVLALIIIAIVLANVVLNVMSNQSRLTHHEISRIQGYYAAQAGAIFAYERLRSGAWVAGVNCTAAVPCSLAALDPEFRDANHGFPASIADVTITIVPVGTAPCINPPGNSTCVYSRADYAYTAH